MWSSQHWQAQKLVLSRQGIHVSGPKAASTTGSLPDRVTADARVIIERNSHLVAVTRRAETPYARQIHKSVASA
jgi:hypothetical protein